MYLVLGITVLVFAVVLSFIGVGVYEFFTEHKQDFKRFHLDHLSKVNPK